MEGKSDKELALEEDPPPPPQGAAVHPTAGPTLDSYVSINDSTEGYDLRFVPHLEPKYECPICLMCLREPVQTECGHRFCRACILRSLRDAGNKCPVDQQPLQKMFPDLCVRREIMDLLAHCPHEECEEILELRNMETHQDACQYGLQPCVNHCGQRIQRRYIEHHSKTECPKRVVHCDFCNVLIAFDHKQVHLDTCPKVTITCDYCKESMIRERLMVHLKNVCPRMVVLCRFHAIGCTHRTERELMQEHLATSMERHMELMASQLQHMHVQTKRSSAHQEAELPDLSAFEHHEYSVYPGYAGGKVGAATVESGINSNVAGLPSSAAVVNAPNPFFSSAAAAEGSPYFKPGYEKPAARILEKDKLKQSYQKGSVSVYQQSEKPQPVHRLHSTDPRYPHPDIRPGHEHHRYPAGDVNPKLQRFSSCDSDVPEMSPEEAGRVIHRLTEETHALREKLKVQEQRAALQKQEMIELHLSSENKIRELSEALERLETKICGGEFVWRLDGYSGLLKEALRGEMSVRHSRGFYTSFYGYKLCLRANFNAPDSSHSQHISLFVHFMRGEYDDILDWPFSGTITLSILDQNEDTSKRKPISETLVAKPELAAFLRPRTNRNHKGFGYMEFAPLEMLSSGAYIKNDCIIIKVRVH